MHEAIAYAVMVIVGIMFIVMHVSERIRKRREEQWTIYDANEWDGQ